MVYDRTYLRFHLTYSPHWFPLSPSLSLSRVYEGQVFNELWSCFDSWTQIWAASTNVRGSTESGFPVSTIPLPHKLNLSVQHTMFLGAQVQFYINSKTYSSQNSSVLWKVVPSLIKLWWCWIFCITFYNLMLLDISTMISSWVALSKKKKMISSWVAYNLLSGYQLLF